MDKHIVDSNVNEDSFSITLIQIPSLNYAVIYGEYDASVEIWGSPRLLTKSVYRAFLLQPEVIGIGFKKEQGLTVFNLNLKEGSNFFELDFSELNKSVFDIEQPHFRW